MSTAVRQDNSLATCPQVLRGLGERYASRSFCNCSIVDAEFLKYLHSDADNASTSDITGALGLRWMPTDIRNQVASDLDTITCEGETLLITRPGRRGDLIATQLMLTLDCHTVPTTLPQAVADAALALTIIGLIICVLCGIFVWLFHRRTAVRTVRCFARLNC